MKQPNILWFCTDQQRFDTIFNLGYSYARTPNLDKFMGKSVTFSHAFCQSPVCTPSRSSFLTGMYPSAIPANQNGNHEFPREAENYLLPKILRDNGYDCGLVGKLHLASAANGIENRVDDGYRFVRYSHDPKGPNLYGHDYAEWIKLKDIDAEKLLGPTEISTELYRNTYSEISDNIKIPSEKNDNIPPDLHQSHWSTEMGIEFINKNRSHNQPWLLSVNPFDPHPEFDPPWDYYKNYDLSTMPLPHFHSEDLVLQQELEVAGIDFQKMARYPEPEVSRNRIACYLAMIELLDHEFGRLINYLNETNQRKNTLIIFSSDHGEMLGDHGLVQKGCRFYEGLVRVPLIISLPKQQPSNLVSDALVELIDIVPTLLDLLNIETPWWIQGKSLVPILNAKTAKSFSEASYNHRSAVRCEFYSTLDLVDQTCATMYRNRKFKLITYHNKDIVELYDLEKDPWEHKNLSADPDHQEILLSLLKSSFSATVDARAPRPNRVASY